MRTLHFILIFVVVTVFSSCLKDYRKVPEKVIREFTNKKGEVTRKITQRDTIIRSYKRGVLVSSITVINGKKEGFGYNYYPGGKVAVRFSYHNNLKNGDEIKYYLSGKKYRVRPYVDGKINGMVKRYYDTGVIMSEQLYENGQATNVLKEYNKNGEPEGNDLKILFRIKPVDNEYFKQRKMLYFYLSNGSKNVRFYHGALVGGKIFPKGAVYTSIRDGIGEIALQPDDLGKTYNIIARIPTKYRNTRIIQGCYTFR